MKENKIFVVKPYLPPIIEYIDLLQEIWSNEYLTNQGPLHQRFEKELKDYFKVKNINLFCNGHLALECGIQALNLPKGGEIITTPFTFVSTTHAIANQGYKPVFCDIKESDYTIDEEKIEALINEKTVAILPVHVYGSPCNVEKIQEIAQKYNLKVIYDAAHAFDVKINGRSILTYGDMSMVSFHATKVFHSIEGGMLVYNDASLYDKLNSIKNFGLKGQEDIIYQGINAKMNEFQAAMGICNLKHINEVEKRRKEIIELYKNGLKFDGIKILITPKNVKNNYAYFPIVIDKKKFGKDRDELFDLLSSKNIFARKYFYPLTSNSIFYKSKNNLDVATTIANNILTLPLYPTMTNEDVERIIEIFRTSHE